MLSVPHPLPVALALQALLFTCDLALQKEVERRPDGGNGGQPPEFLPGGLDGGAQDVGRQQELQGQRQRAADAQPDVFTREGLDLPNEIAAVAPYGWLPWQDLLPDMLESATRSALGVLPPVGV